MNDIRPHTVYRKDYRLPDYLVDSTVLCFELEPNSTLVKSSLEIRRNPALAEGLPPLRLDGVDLQLLYIAVDGEPLPPSRYRELQQGLSVQVDKPEFLLEIHNRINPGDNTSLEGLYLSNGMYCTQCEAEGFRKITYYPDRPDVMSRFTTSIVAPPQYPVLLSNGNEIDRGRMDDGRQFVTWEDPFAKPAYLFALVAGDLECVEDSFSTASGRRVKLQIFTEAKNIGKCAHAMSSLKKAMRWDEEVYGREYDLDIFMIVAVDHFNMGAMENKGLNIFNSACVLSSPATATDGAFQRIESIVAHEYFHNWSGNRVTCRDWFQLSLKEGFTVFRDAEFSADMNSRKVKRIEDATRLRTAQFAEDAGPMAHPVRPDSYMEISNFYTLTVYEKGAEVVRMIHTLLGPEGFRRGTDLYFTRHDGCAVTCEDFVRSMEDANGVDLTQFRRWYSQAGTPVVHVSETYDAEAGEYRLTFRQSCPPTPGQSEKLPLHIPIAMGLLASDGTELALDAAGNSSRVLEITEPEQSFTFSAPAAKPLPSLLRGFSAPVKLSFEYTDEQLQFLMQFDRDAFNQWDAGQRLAFNAIERLQANYRSGAALEPPAALIGACRGLLQRDSTDPALLAEMLSLPSAQALAEHADPIDAEAIVAARDFCRRSLGKSLEGELLECYRRLNTLKPYRPKAEDIAERSLKNTCLGYLAASGSAEGIRLARAQYLGAENMTDSSAALRVLVNHADREVARQALDDFYQRWQEDTQVVELWLSLQSSSASYGSLDLIRELMQHPAFELTNPNKVRAVIGGFANGNFTQFHSIDGSGYQFLAEQVVALDSLNPQIAARLVLPLTHWKKYLSQVGENMRAALASVMAGGQLSADLYEVVSKSL
ncbi:aminopeptidase N [Microbulbifer discodermiae]|uniref:aminopeptidase N n=1 Tax=Microbulbifer sp. 2201CG32-9 TaxID=3232309 RepID=UPI00345B780B